MSEVFDKWAWIIPLKKQSAFKVLLGMFQVDILLNQGHTGVQDFVLIPSLTAFGDLV